MPHVFESFEEVTKGIEKSRKTEDCLHVFSKAFDKDQHESLVQKVRTHETQGEPDNWIEN